MHLRRRATAIVAAMAAATVLGASAAVAAPTRQREPQPGGSSLPVAVPASGTFYPMAVSRLLGMDSAGYALAPGAAVSIAVSGRGGLPSSGISAVVLNVTAAAGSAEAGLSFRPTGSPVGATSAAPLLTVPSGGTRSALLTLPLAGAGGLDVAANAAATVSADLVGFYAADDTVIGSQGASGGYQPVDVARLYSTDTSGPLAAGARQTVSVDLGAVAEAHTTALLVRATATGAQAPGSLTVTGTGADTTPATSAVSYAAGAPATNLALVRARRGVGPVDVIVTNASTGATGVELDLVGFYDDGGLGPNVRFRPLPQTRVVDTGVGLGTGPLQPGLRVTATPDQGVVGDSTFGLVGVVTASSGAAARLGVDAADDSTASAVPVAGAATTSVSVQTEVGAALGIGLEARFDAATPGTGTATMNLTMDVTGSFEAYPPVTNPAARRWVPPVSPWQITAVAR